MSTTLSIEVFSTSPQSSDTPRDEYLDRVVDVARWSESAGCSGILVYTDNSLVDPWLVAQVIVEHTTRLCPLVAVQPVYMHPYSVAKMVSSIAHLYGRRLFLNMVAGGFKNDLLALNDTTPHDDRYARLIEYTAIIRALLTSPTPVTINGKFYTVKNLTLRPSCPPQLEPGVFISGSSDAGLEAAESLGATAIQYPRPAGDLEKFTRKDGCDYGIRVGVIARGSAEEAWGVAHQRFPEDRKGELAHQLAMKTSDSVWHRDLSGRTKQHDGETVYWMLPFETYKTFCPYLVGSYDEVALELSRYVALGYRKVILDIPPCAEELQNINLVFRRVGQYA